MPGGIIYTLKNETSLLHKFVMKYHNKICHILIPNKPRYGIDKTSGTNKYITGKHKWYCFFSASIVSALHWCIYVILCGILPIIHYTTCCLQSLCPVYWFFIMDLVYCLPTFLLPSPVTSRTVISIPLPLITCHSISLSLQYYEEILFRIY